LTPRKFAAFDVESTCMRGPGCRIVSAALVEIRDNNLLLSTARYAIESPRKQVGRTALIHGVTGAGRFQIGSLDSLLQEAANNYVLITYGRHDVNLLIQEAERRRLSIGKVCFIDLLEYLLRNPSRRQIAMQRGGYPLKSAIKELLGINPPRAKFHDPLVDSIYTGLIYIKLLKQGANLSPECIGSRGDMLQRLLKRVTKLLRLF